MSATGIFVAGTDTGVGKTYVSVGLVRALVADGQRVATMKPVAAGTELTPAGPRNDDALALMAAANVAAPYERVNPYALPLAASPHLAARAAGVQIDRETVRGQYEALAADADLVIVEGAGGWLAPISDQETMADIVRALDLPVLLVVGLRLGCLNHALLSAAAIAAQATPLLGWIANSIDPTMPMRAENIATLTNRLGSTPLAVIPANSTAADANALNSHWTEASAALRRALTVYRTQSRVSP
ncbi:MAG: dethiobiotin synthase [Steroidobacteraceae bacterium]